MGDRDVEKQVLTVLHSTWKWECPSRGIQFNSPDNLNNNFRKVWHNEFIIYAFALFFSVKYKVDKYFHLNPDIATLARSVCTELPKYDAGFIAVV